MKEFKNFCKSNRVFVVLMAIVLICTVIIGICLISYFYGGNKYKDTRSEEIKKYEISDSHVKEIESKFIADEQINKVTITFSGPKTTIYIKLEFAPKVSLVEAEGKALLVLDEFSEDEKKAYDFQFTLIQDATTESEGFKIAGAKNKNGTNLVWTQNNKPEETDNEETKK
ncbi:MAG: hypothetical protein ACI31M_03615 [Bacilli bacterium]